MTSSNGNIFRVTGHLCGEFTGPRWFPRTKASDAELGFFYLRLNKRLSKQSWGWWFETLSCSLWRHCDEPIDNWWHTHSSVDWSLLVQVMTCRLFVVKQSPKSSLSIWPRETASANIYSNVVNFIQGGRRKARASQSSQNGCTWIGHWSSRKIIRTVVNIVHQFVRCFCLPCTITVPPLADQ